MSVLAQPTNPVARQIVSVLNDPDIEIPDAKRAELENAVRLIESGASEEIHPPNIPSDEPIPGHDVEADARRAENNGNYPRPDAEMIRPANYSHGNAPSLDVPVGGLSAGGGNQEARLAALESLIATALAPALAAQQQDAPPANDLMEPETTPTFPKPQSDPTVEPPAEDFEPRGN